MGNLFASPSTQQVRSVAAHAHNGGGVLLTYGNYAGDVLNFDAAQEQLLDAGPLPSEVARGRRADRRLERVRVGLLVVEVVAVEDEVPHRREPLRLERHDRVARRVPGPDVPVRDVPVPDVPDAPAPCARQPAASARSTRVVRTSGVIPR